MNCSIVHLDKFGQDVYIFIRVFIRKISGQFIAERYVDAFHDRTFVVGISSLKTLYPHVLTTSGIEYSKTLSPYLYAPTRVVCVWVSCVWGPVI